MIPFSLLLMALAFETAADPQRAPSSDGPQTDIVQQIAASGRAASVAESLSRRIAPPPSVTPGAPPLFTFRYYEGRARHRFGETDLVLDDAGH